MFKAGLRVQHPLFGTGTIRAVTGSGNDAKLTIDFAPSVGQKKLLASVAKLKLLDVEDEDGQPLPSAPAAPAAWYEILDAQFALRAGHRAPDDDVHARLRRDITQADFWAAVRERVRTLGHAPRVLDDPH